MSCQGLESEYVNSKFKRAKNKKRKKVILCVFLVIFFVFFLIVMYFNNVFNPILFSYGEAELKKMLVVSSNQAIKDLPTITYDDIITISYTDQNNISLISANSQKVNQIANTLARLTQQSIDNATSCGLQIPFGTLTGIPFLVGRGCNLNFAVNSIGNAKCNFYTSFESSGINQTNHKIFVCIESEVSLILPFNIKKINNKANFLLSECVIIGKVPNTYLNITSLNDLPKSG